MRSAELAVALVLDATIGEPPSRAHPVVWMGRLVDVLERHASGGDSARAARRAGATAALVGTGAVLGVAALAARLPWPLRGVALWPLLSARLLLAEVGAVERALETGGIEAGRARVAGLVSRPTATLSPEQVRAAAVQSLAENTTDAVTATLWWWSIGGLPAAAVHRWADTLDSRWGYRDERYRDLGWAAAHADDVLAWVPARLTGLLWRGRLDRALRREARRVPSPNGGWTMGAAALATDCRLEKPGAYVLHPTGRAPTAATVAAAHRDARRVLVTAAAITVLVAAGRDGMRARRPDRGGAP